MDILSFLHFSTCFFETNKTDDLTDKIGNVIFLKLKYSFS